VEKKTTENPGTAPLDGSSQLNQSLPPHIFTALSSSPFLFFSFPFGLVLREPVAALVGVGRWRVTGWRKKKATSRKKKLEKRKRKSNRIMIGSHNNNTSLQQSAQFDRNERSSQTSPTIRITLVLTVTLLNSCAVVTDWH